MKSPTCCAANQEEDEMWTAIVCNIRDKDTQRELWKLENKDKDLEGILTHIRASSTRQPSPTRLLQLHAQCTYIPCHCSYSCTCT